MSRSFNEAIVSEEFNDQLNDELYEEGYGDDGLYEDTPSEVDEQVTSGSVPARFTIIPDDYHADFAGTAEDGRRFFLTTPFDPSSSEFVAVFLWRADGTFDEIRIDDLGPRDDLADGVQEAAIEKRLDELGDYRIEPISVAPFAVQSYGLTFGFVPNVSPGAGGDGEVWVSVQPGDYMAYYAPWNNGEYDT